MRRSRRKSTPCNSIRVPTGIMPISVARAAGSQARKALLGSGFEADALERMMHTALREFDDPFDRIAAARIDHVGRTERAVQGRA